jgi:hypothetical protein
MFQSEHSALMFRLEHISVMFQLEHSAKTRLYYYKLLA